MESAQAKNQALTDAGAIVPTSYEAFEISIKETFQKLVCLHTFITRVVNFDQFMGQFGLYLVSNR